MDAAILKLLTERGRVYIAMMEREPSGVCWDSGFIPPRGPTITELTVLSHGDVTDLYDRKRYVVVSFVYKGQESESVRVLEQDVTTEGLLKAADSFLIGLDYE